MFDGWRGMVFGVLIGLGSAGLILLFSRSEEGVPVALVPPATAAPTATALPLRVHVTGAVAAPGVYGLPPGSIAADALAAAGGVTARADVERLNLASLLVDGSQVFVPEQALPAATSNISAAAVVPKPDDQVLVSGPININTATAAELETLPRIGPAIAQRVVEYRETRGAFQSIEELTNVRGIGSVTLEQLRDLITVGP